LASSRQTKKGEGDGQFFPIRRGEKKKKGGISSGSKKTWTGSVALPEKEEGYFCSIGRTRKKKRERKRRAILSMRKKGGNPRLGPQLEGTTLGGEKQSQCGRFSVQEEEKIDREGGEERKGGGIFFLIRQCLAVGVKGLSRKEKKEGPRAVPLDAKRGEKDRDWVANSPRFRGRKEKK